MKKLLFALFTFVSLTLPTKAHNVIWFEISIPQFDFLPMEIPIDASAVFASVPPSAVFSVVPSAGEPCTVIVHLDPITSPYLKADIITANPAVEVDVRVTAIQFPPDEQPINYNLTGYWSATGFPENNNCDATNQNRFTVPVLFGFYKDPNIDYNKGTDKIDFSTSSPAALQTSSSVNGPWVNTGVGKTFSADRDEQTQFFRTIRQLGGALSGTVTDGSGAPQTGVTIGLPSGGAVGNSDAGGFFSIFKLPLGDNILQFLKSFTFVDPNTNQSRTDTAGLDILVPSISGFDAFNLKVETKLFPLAGCNCTPWASIGFGNLNGAATPIYYSGGANPPKGGSAADCDKPVVTVTPPNGAPFTIRPGIGKHQNTGPNPATGTWTVTTTVCNQSKSVSISYP